MADTRKSSSRKSGSGKEPPETPRPTDRDDRLSVLVELRGGPGASQAHAMNIAEQIEEPGFKIDHAFQPVPLGEGGGDFAAGTETYIVRGTVADEAEIEALRRRPDVVDVIPDTPIAPFAAMDPMPDVELNESAGVCAIPPCDCGPGTPKGTMADVAAYLGVNQVWSAGFRGTGMVVGVLDSGITAQGRPVKSGETTRRIGRVIGGWPADWGTESSKWGDHGNMCATDVLGMSPEAQLYDLRIAGSGGSPGTISRALQAFQWAIDRHRVDGTPHVLTNSWGIFQETWDATYARNPNHPFTRKVVEAINEGILVLFAAGNCGAGCPDGRCGPDNGPGRSIWGANGHASVMTVGAGNKNEQYIGYSSQGPAALDPNKPDFCSISHFTGYFNSDSGTSAATPILAGVVALLKQAAPTATQGSIKNCLKSTAKDIGPPGFDQHSGAGIVQAKRALDCIRPIVFPPATLRPPCGVVTVRPGCPPPRTLRPPCPPRTFGPPCPPIRTFGPACPPPTLVPRCPPRTLGPPCPPIRTFGPACPPRTVGPPCGIRTVGPPCGIQTAGPSCPPATVACRTIACGIPDPGIPSHGVDPGGYGHEAHDPAEYGYPPPDAGEYGYPPAETAGHGGETGGGDWGGGHEAGAEYGHPETAEYGYPEPGEYGYGDPYAQG